MEQGLLELKILREGDRTDSAQDGDDSDSIERRVEELAAGQEHGLLHVLMLPKERIEPVLSSRYTAAAEFDVLEADRARLAKALAWCGNPVGNAVLLEEMKTLREQEVEAGRLPREHQPEDAGTPYWPINQNIALLGMSGEPRVLPAILEIADSLELNNPPVEWDDDYQQGRIDRCLIPYHNRMINICFAVERMPDRRAVSSLKRFLDDPYIGGNVTRAEEEARRNVFPAILESRIAATLARCGAKRGFDVLVEYLSDVHCLLADYAHRELCSILPEDYGFEAEKWKDYVNSLTFPMPTVPRDVEEIEL